MATLTGLQDEGPDWGGSGGAPIELPGNSLFNLK